MDRTSEYVSHVECTADFYQEQGPVYLNFVCALNGVEAIDLTRPYTCLELGCGRGVTAAILAAGNPNGTFYAADINPAYIAGAQAMADAAQLDNLVLLENSFADLAQGMVALPQFDIITLHGVYTWVSEENRAHIVEFLTHYLKPGGIVYLSYNCMPGWTATLPLQRLLAEHAAVYPGLGAAAVDGAAAFLDKLKAVDAGYLAHNPSARQQLDVIAGGDRGPLVHDYLQPHWQPLYYADVARSLAPAKLELVGSADLPLTFPALYLTRERQDMLAGVPDPVLRETIKDYFQNTGFRRDVFVRGPRKMTAARQLDRLSQFGLALIVPRSACTLTLEVSVGKLEANQELYTAVFDALAARPHTLAELAALPPLKDKGAALWAQVAVLLVASGQAALYHCGHSGDLGDQGHGGHSGDQGDQGHSGDQGDQGHGDGSDHHGGAQADAAAARRLNRHLASQVRYGNDIHALATPLAGSGIDTGLVARIVYWIITRQPGAVAMPALPELQQQVWQALQDSGRRVTAAGATAEAEAQARAELDARVEQIVRDTVPLWRQLAML